MGHFGSNTAPKCRGNSSASGFLAGRQKPLGARSDLSASVFVLESSTNPPIRLRSDSSAETKVSRSAKRSLFQRPAEHRSEQRRRGSRRTPVRICLILAKVFTNNPSPRSNRSFAIVGDIGRSVDLCIAHPRIRAGRSVALERSAESSCCQATATPGGDPLAELPPRARQGSSGEIARFSPEHASEDFRFRCPWGQAPVA